MQFYTSHAYIIFSGDAHISIHQKNQHEKSKRERKKNEKWTRRTMLVSSQTLTWERRMSEDSYACFNMVVFLLGDALFLLSVRAWYTTCNAFPLEIPRWAMILSSPIVLNGLNLGITWYYACESVEGLLYDRFMFWDINPCKPATIIQETPIINIWNHLWK